MRTGGRPFADGASPRAVGNDLCIPHSVFLFDTPPTILRGRLLPVPCGVNRVDFNPGAHISLKASMVKSELTSVGHVATSHWFLGS